MRYTWDPKKARLNKEKHGITFPEAIRIFDQYTFEQIDDREDYGEERIFAMGLYRDRVLVVIYADHGDIRRIISARKAKRHEEAIFWEAKGAEPRQ
jgi:uncharacterized DUF497 family protein